MNVFGANCDDRKGKKKEDFSEDILDDFGGWDDFENKVSLRLRVF